MVDQEKLKQTVVRALNLDQSKYRSDLGLGDVMEWDSLAHLNLIFAIEDAFELKFKTEVIGKLKTLPLIEAELQRALQTR